MTNGAAWKSRIFLGGNTVLAQIVGLSPLLAVSTTATTAAGLGITTLLVTVFSCVSASLFKPVLTAPWRLIYLLAIIGLYTTAAGFVMAAFFYPLSLQLGIYVPLICCNGIILLRMETHARHNNTLSALGDSLLTALGFLWLIVLLGMIREVLSYGTVFDHMELLMPNRVDQSAEPGNPSFRFAPLPPAALILLGLVVALLNLVGKKFAAKLEPQSSSVAQVKRLRVTGRS